MASATILSPSKIDIPTDHAQIILPMPEIDQTQVSYWLDLVRAELIKVDDETCTVDARIMDAPRRRSAQPLLAAAIATNMYPELSTQKAVQQYESDIKSLRSSVTRQRWATAVHAEPRETWRSRIQAQGAWDELNDPVSSHGAISLPMPVDQASKDSLAPFFKHLQSDGAISADSKAVLGNELGTDMQLVEYPKGVLYADGRVDLCKVVVGPRSIQDLMDSLKSNTFVKHFLLGNNIIGAVGAKAIASFVDDQPNKFETWYLAGNCINGDSLKLLVDSMLKSTAITNVWLKRNPLGSDAAADVARLISGSHIQTLDLDQTELGDAGVAELFSILSTNASPTSLRHIYINACGVSTACKQIADYLASPSCKLESLYMSCNPVGNAVTLLADGLKNNHSLKRLTLQSCGLKGDTTATLLNAVVSHPALIKIDLGQAYTTEDLDQRYNWLTDECADALVEVTETTALQCLLLDDVPMSRTALNKILTAVAASKSTLLFSARTLPDSNRYKDSQALRKEHVRLQDEVQQTLCRNVQQKYGCSYDQFLSKHKRSIISPPGIELIDSVYRTRDVGLARRGLMTLEKYWDEGDDTARRSEQGLLE